MYTTKRHSGTSQSSQIGFQSTPPLSRAKKVNKMTFLSSIFKHVCFPHPGCLKNSGWSFMSCYIYIYICCKQILRVTLRWHTQQTHLYTYVYIYIHICVFIVFIFAKKRKGPYIYIYWFLIYIYIYGYIMRYWDCESWSFLHQKKTSAPLTVWRPTHSKLPDVIATTESKHLRGCHQSLDTSHSDLIRHQSLDTSSITDICNTRHLNTYHLCVRMNLLC